MSSNDHKRGFVEELSCVDDGRKYGWSRPHTERINCSASSRPPSKLANPWSSWLYFLVDCTATVNVVSIIHHRRIKWTREWAIFPPNMKTKSSKSQWLIFESDDRWQMTQNWHQRSFDLFDQTPCAGCAKDTRSDMDQLSTSFPYSQSIFLIPTLSISLSVCFFVVGLLCLHLRPLKK